MTFLFVSILLVLLPGLLITLLIMLSTRLWNSTRQDIDKNRRDQWELIELFGRELGLIFASDRNNFTQILTRFPDFELVQKRSSVPYSLSGKANECDFWILDFGPQEFYDMPDGVSILSKGWIYLLIHSESLKLPSFSLKSAPPLPWINTTKFSNHPRFSRRYQIAGKNKVAIQSIFKPALISHLEGKSHSLNLWGNGSFLLYSKGWRNLDNINSVKKLNDFIEEGFTLYDLFSQEE